MRAGAAYRYETVEPHGFIVAHHLGELAFAVVAHHFHLLEGLAGRTQNGAALIEYALEVVAAEEIALAADEPAVAIGNAHELHAL